MTTTLAVVGAGNLGRGLAHLAAAAGVPTLLSNSRGPGTLSDLVASMTGDVRAASTVDAIAQADVVILALPIAAALELDGDALRGKIVIDATNYLPAHTGPISAIDESGTTSSEFLRTRLAAPRLVKALNNVDFLRLPRLSRAAGDTDRSALPLAGDDRDANAAVEALLDALGFDALNLGPLAEGWRAQPGTPLYVTPYFTVADDTETDPGARFMNAITNPVPAGAAAALAAAATH